MTCEEWSNALVYKHISKVINLGLTFTGFDSLKPAVTRAFVVEIPTIFMPRTSRSTTADSAGFLEYAAVCTGHDRRGDACRGE